METISDTIDAVGRRLVGRALLRARNAVLYDVTGSGVSSYLSKRQYLSNLPDQGKRELSDFADDCLICALHAILELLEQDSYDANLEYPTLKLIANMRDGGQVDIGDIPYGVAGALYGEDGWIEKYFLHE